MAGNQYSLMQGKLIRLTMHNELMSGNLSQSWFLKCFNNLSGNFGISFEGTTHILSVPWRDVVQYCKAIMFFGKQFNQQRPWGPVFWFKNNPEYAHHVFCSFALEFFGDSQVSVQLFAMYNSCLCNIYQQRSLVIASPSSTQTKRKTTSFDTERAWSFQYHFDAFCKLAFTNCFSKFNDYTMPILLTADFTSFQNRSKNIPWRMDIPVVAL